MRVELESYLAKLRDEPDKRNALEGVRALVRQAEPGSDPAALRLLEEARRQHRERGDSELAAELLDLELFTAPEARRADILHEQAKLFYEELLDQEMAIAALEESLNLRADDTTRRYLDQVKLVRDNWERIAQKYASEAASATERQLKTSLFVSAAETVARNRPASDDVESNLRAALQVDPRNRRALLHLERLLRRQERYADLAGLLEQRAEAASTGEERALALGTAAGITANKLGDHARAVELHRKVLAIDPAHPRSLRFLVDHYTEQGSWESLVRLYESALKARRAGEPEMGMLLQIGMLWWKKINNLDSAEPFFRRIRQAEAAHPAALDFYRDYHGARGEGSKLLQTLEQQLRTEENPQKKLEMSEELALVAEERAQNLDKAIEVWKGVLRLAPGRPAAREALKRLYPRTEKWNALRELLKEELDALPHGEVEERVQLLLQIAAIYRDRLKLDAMVVNTYGQILQLQPDHRESLTELEHKYEAMGRWNDLAQLLTRRAERETDPTKRLPLLSRVANVWLERFSNPANAVKPLEGMLEIDPGNAEAIAKLRDIHEKRRNWKGLLEVMQRELVLRSGATRRALIGEMAKIAGERLNDAREAIGLWNLALEADPDDAEALERLAPLYEREKRYPALAEIFHRQRLALGDDAKALGLLEKMGALFSEKMGAPAAAVEVWRDALQLRPDHAKALRALRDLYTHTEDWAALEALFAERGNWAELCETLSQAADRAPQESQRITLLRRVAEIATDPARLGRVEVAQKAWERILAVDPDNVDAAVALAPIYEKASLWPRLLAMQEVLLAAAQTKFGQLAILADLRELCEKRLGSKGLAFRWCSRAFALEPNDAAVRLETLRLGREAAALEELVTLLVAHVEKISDEDSRADLYRTAGDLLRRDLARPFDARECYEKVLQRRPTDREALEALEEILGALDEPAALRDVLDRRASIEADIPRRIDVLLRVAYLDEERLEDSAAAVQTFERIRELAPRRMATLHALARLHQARGDWQALRHIYQAQLDLASDPQARAQVFFLLGQLEGSQLHDASAAIESFRDALESDAHHSGALAALEAAMQSGDARVRVARLLTGHYERTQNWRGFATALQVLADDESGVERAGLLRRLIAIHENHLRDPAGLYEASAQLLEAAPDDASNRAVLGDRAEAANRLENLAERFYAVAGRQSGDLAAELWMECGNLSDTRLLDPAKAEKAYRHVLQLQSHHTAAFEAMRQILGALERFEELRELLLQRAELVVDAGERKELFLQVAEICEDMLDDRPAAAEAREKVLHIDGRHLPSYKKLEKHYDRLSEPKRLEDLLARERDVVSDKEKVSLDIRRARLRAQSLSDAAGAVDLVEQVLAVEPGHEDAVALLETLLSERAVRLRVARLLIPAFEQRRDFAKLTDTLRVERDESAENERFEITVRMAEIQEKEVSDVAKAFGFWREALVMEPGDERPRRAIERLSGPYSRWKEVAQVWEEGFRAAPKANVALRAELGRKVAEVYDEHLRDAARAREAWKAVLEIDPDNAAIGVTGARALERLYEAASMWPELCAVLRRQAAWLEDPTARRPLLLRVARIVEETGDVDEAIATYREILEAEPQSREALDQLERLFLASERWADLVDTLQRKLELADSTERRDLRGRLAILFDEMLSDPGQAISVYLEILEGDRSDLEALQALSRLYERQERWADKLEVLERRLRLATRPRDRISLLLELASLDSDKLSHPSGALERYESVLSLEPSHAGARDALRQMLKDETLAGRAAWLLEPLYRADGDHRRLAQIHQIQAKLAASTGDRVALLRRAADVLERGATDLPAAFQMFGRAAREAAPEATLFDVLADVERLSTTLGKERELVDLLKEIAGDVADAELRDRVHMRIAELASQLTDRVTARDYFRRVLDSQPGNEKALDALETLYELESDWEAVLSLLFRRVDLYVETPERRIDYLWKAAQLCSRRLQRPGDAIAAYEQILQIDPTHAAAAAELEVLYALPEIARWADLADLLEKRIARTRDVREAATIRFRLAQVYEEQLHEPMRALELAGQVLAVDANHDGAVDLAAKRLDDPVVRGQAAAVLEPVYAARQDWPRLARIHEIHLDAVVEPEERRELLSRMARLHEEQLDDLDKALDWYAKAWQADPSDRKVRDQVLRVAAVLERWNVAAELLQKYLDDTLEESHATQDTARLLGNLYEERLANPERARDAYLRALRIDRNDQALFGRLEACLSRAGRWTDLIDVYREMADAMPDPARRREFLVRTARVLEENVERPEEAIGTWREVLDINTNDPAAFTALDRLLQTNHRWTDLVELLLRQLEAADPGQQVALRYRLGTIYEKQLEDSTAAVDAYEEVLRARPDHREARQSLEGLLGDARQRLRVAQILQPIYRAAGDPARLVDALRAELELIEDRQRRLEILREMAHEYESKLHRLDDAYEALGGAFTEDPSMFDVLTDLDRIAGLMGQHDDLAKRIGKALDGIYDVEVFRELSARLAKIHERLRDRNQAIAAWRRLLDMAEGDEVALTELDRLLTIEQRHEDLAGVLTQRADRAAAPADRIAFLRRLADTQENLLVRSDLAMETWRNVLSLSENESDPASIEALDRLYLGAERWADLVWIYAKKIAATSDANDRRRLRVAVAGIYEDRIHDTFEAISAWRAVLADDPDDTTALAALDRLYTKEANYSDLVTIIDAESRQANGPARAALEYRAARIVERELGDVVDAIARYAAVVEKLPTHIEARQSLEGLISDPGQRDAVGAVLEDLYPKLGDHGALVALWELRAQDANDTAERVELYRKAAMLRLDKLRDPEGAFQSLAAALAEDPGDERTTELLEQIVARDDKWPELATLYEDRLRDVFDPELQRRYQLRLARLAEESLGDESRAIDWHRKAVESGADERTQLETLDRLLERNGRFAELAEVLMRQAELHDEPLEQSAFLVRLGLVRELELKDLDGALSAYRDALERDPGATAALEGLGRIARDPARRVDALDVLEPAYERLGDARKLIEMSGLRLSIATDPSEQVRLFRRNAELLEKPLGDRVAALESLLLALEADPTDAQVPQEIDRLAKETNRFADVCARVDALLGRGVATEAQRDLGLRCAKWWRDQVGDAGRAEVRLRDVIRADADSKDAWVELGTIYRASGQKQELAETLRRRAEMTLDGEERGRLLAEAAQTIAETGDLEAEIAAWRSLLDVDETDDRALRALADAYERSGRREELVDILLRRARLQQGADAVALLLRAGSLLLDDLAQIDRAADTYRDVLDHDPENATALTALERIYRERGDFASVQEILMRRLGDAKGGDRRETLEKLASVAEQSGSVEEAIDYVRQMVEDRPDEATQEGGAAERLLALYERAEKWFDLGEALEQRAEALRASSDPRELDTWVRVAHVREDKLDDVDGASRALERVLEREPLHPGALTGLARLQERAGDWEKSVETLGRALEVTRSGREAAEVHFRIAKARGEGLGDDAGAIAALESAVAADAEYAPALDELERRTREQADYAKLCEVLALRKAAEKDPARRLELCRELGRLQLEELKDPAAALPYLEEAARLAPDDPKVQVALGDLYFAAGKFEHAEDAYRRVAGAKTKRSREAAHVMAQLASLAERRGDTAAAMECYDEAHKIDSTHAPTLAAVGRLAMAAGDAEKARKAYRSILLGNLEDAAHLPKGDVHLHLGTLHARAGETAKALNMFERGLETAPDHSGLQQAIADLKK